MTSAVEHLSDRAQKCRSTAQVRNMLARAERMAEYYARLLAASFLAGFAIGKFAVLPIVGWLL